MIESLVLIFVGAMLLGSVAMFVRQPLIIVYIVIGVAIGPFAAGWVSEAEVLTEVAEIGILFLLFIVGLELPPKKLMGMFGTSFIAAVLSSLAFLAIGFGIGWLIGFTPIEALVMGIGFMFSSTVLGVKLLPRTVLHHRKIGDIVIGLLLIQDIIAVTSLVALHTSFGLSEGGAPSIYFLLAAIPVLVVAAILGPKFLIWPMMKRFDVFTEFTFILYIGWCLALAAVAHFFGVGLELGAFVAGVALANSPVSQSVSERLEPLRDFFLVLFFFSVGARVDISLIGDVLLPAVLIAIFLVAIKPVAFRYLLAIRRVRRPIGWEVGVRLGQCSEFSLLVVFVAAPLLSAKADLTILTITILTMAISTYVVVFNYRSPLAIKDELRVD